VKLVVSDAHEGVKATVSKVLSATWQRCRVHFMRNALAHAGRSGRRVVSAFIATAFAQDDAEAAKTQWRRVADQLRPKVPKLATLMDEAEPDVPRGAPAPVLKPFTLILIKVRRVLRRILLRDMGGGFHGRSLSTDSTDGSHRWLATPARGVPGT
jgi:hypothetical protein